MKYAIYPFEQPIHIQPKDQFRLTVQNRLFSPSVGRSLPQGETIVHSWVFDRAIVLTHYARVHYGPVSIGYVVGDENLERELRESGGRPYVS